MRLIIFVVGGTLLITAGLVFGLPYLSQEEGKGRIEIVPLEYDAGIVSMADGLVKHTYEIRNKGAGDLEIDRIWTNCGCTTAILKAGDKVSPKFGMPSHGINPIFWSQKIAPEETGFLEVFFDPAFHGPEGTGFAVRVVSLSTNDPQNKKAEVRLIANVVQ